MIKYDNNTIAGWYKDGSELIKVYKNGAVCYYKAVQGDTGQTPCFAVVEDISQYSDTEFVDVYDKATDKWYKLNNLDQYEEYGVYGSGRTITYYEGKLTIDNGYEYEYSGGSWVNIGEVSGGTVTLPEVPFTVNINAKDYDVATKTFHKTSGQLADTDVVITAGTPAFHDTYVTVASGTRGVISGYQQYFNRDASNPNLTIISKQRTDGNDGHIFANRGTKYNWMYRVFSTQLAFHGAQSIGGTSVTTQPVIESVRVDGSRLLTFNNYTDNTTTSWQGFNYGNANSDGTALFAGYANTTTGEWFIGDFYWVYMSQNTLTDEQVRQVIEYNEGEGRAVYPKYYTVMEAPEDNVTFTDMAEAEAYECPWVGMHAYIGGDKYIFTSGYTWEVIPLPYDAEIEYLESTGSQHINTGVYVDRVKFEIGYTVAGKGGQFGFVHQNVAGGTWMSVDETNAFFGNWYSSNRVPISAYTSPVETTVKYTNTGVTVNGTTISKSMSLAGTDNPSLYELPIFAWYDFYRGGIEYSFNSKFKSFYVKTNGELVLDMIPVRVGQVGYMYDRVSGELFGNDGTGSFILGADKN